MGSEQRPENSSIGWPANGEHVSARRFSMRFRTLLNLRCRRSIKSPDIGKGLATLVNSQPAPLLGPAHLYDQDGLRSCHNHEFMDDPHFQASYRRGVQAAGVRDYN